MTKMKYLSILLIIFIISCASTPETVEETPTENTSEEIVEEVIEEEVIEVEPEPVIIEEPVVEEEPVIVEEEVYVPEPLDENLLLNAKKEIFKAEEARAKTYFPHKLELLKRKLAEATSIKDTDPDQARILLSEITVESNQLVLESLAALKTACINILNDQSNKLVKIKADKYTPKEYEVTVEHKKNSISAFENNDLTESLAKYRIAYTSQTNLYNSLSKNLTYIDSLLRLINNYKVEGEAIDVEKWAPEEYNLAVESYKESYDYLYKTYQAVEADASLRNTLFLAKKAVAQAKVNIEVAQTDDEIFNLMNELEQASSLTILDRDDNIINPETWNGKADLKAKPIEAKVDKDEESGLTPIDLESNIDVEYPITDGESGVLGVNETRKSLLAEAKELWSLGIEARNNGDLITAKEYLAKSKVYLDEYKSMAVNNIYTVVLNPEDRDCLWKIAERDEFYGDPFLWQNIWERNKKLIQDPDLIYPGWKLIIPPLEN